MLLVVVISIIYIRVYTLSVNEGIRYKNKGPIESINHKNDITLLSSSSSARTAEKRREVLATAWTLQCRVRLTTAQCRVPSDAEKQKSQLRKKVHDEYLLGYWTFNMIDDFRKNTRPERPKNLIDLMPRKTWFYGEKKCRQNRNITHDSDINSKSTCPWYTVLDVDLQREPRSIAKAKCSCQQCFTTDGSDRTRDICTEMNNFIPVVKWRCQHNFSGSKPNYFQYFVDFETVPVGCTCQRPDKVEK